MGKVEGFLVLGIEPTRDEKQIKNAYRQRLTVTNPEDDPEGFKRLRTAYEEACAYARQPEDEAEETQTERDTTPSGLWLEKAAELYNNIKSRQNPELWQKLFEEDTFLSLEGEEECGQKLLRFLMEHFRLPSAVWKVLNHNMQLVEDAEKLREHFPTQFVNFVLNRCERGEDVDFELFEGEENAPYDDFLNCYDNCWQALQEGKLEEAEQLLKEADGLHIYHPAMEVCRGNLLCAQNKNDEAVRFMKGLRRRHPNNTMVCYNAAEIFWKLKERDEAAEIFLELKKANEKHYMANLRLTEWYYEKEEYAEAKKCAENVLASGADDSFMDLLVKINAKLERGLELKWRDEEDWNSAMELCWCYLQDGKTSKGIKLAEVLKPYISQEREAEYYGLMAKLHVEAADFEEAVKLAETWEELLEKKMAQEESEEDKERDKDRVRQSHLIRMQCYRNLGYRKKEYFDKAITELEAVESGTLKDVGLWLEKAQIYMEMEEYDKSLQVTSRLIEEYQVYAAAATAMEVYRRQWDAGGVVRNARMCIQRFPDYVRAYEHLGRVYLDLQETEDLSDLLNEAEKNKIQSPYLEAYRYQMDKTPPEIEVLNSRLEAFQKDFQEPLESGQMLYYEAGLPVINEYLYWYPGAYMLRRRGAFHKSGQQLGKALADYEKALEEEPNNPYIYSSISQICLLQGDYERALVSTKKAVLYGDEDWVNTLYYHMARIYMLLGDNEHALSLFERYEQTADAKKGHVNSMAMCMARLGMEEASNKISGAEKASRMQWSNDKSWNVYLDEYYREILRIYRVLGERQAERTELDRWRRKLRPENPRRKWLLDRIGIDSDAWLNAVMDYYNCEGWYALLGGDGTAALDFFRRQIEKDVQRRGDNAKEGLEDAIFAAILYGEEQRGKRYAGALKQWMDRSSLKAVDEYYGRPKAKITAEFLANYYTFSEEQLQEILDREKECAICGFCLMPLCQELEGMRVLLLLRQGRIDEAKEKVSRNLEVQPYDEYMMAFRAFWQAETA
jgi:hypothetical protein